MLATNSVIKASAKDCPFYTKVPTRKGWRVIWVNALLNEWIVDSHYVSKDGLTEQQANKLIIKLEEKENE